MFLFFFPRQWGSRRKVRRLPPSPAHVFPFLFLFLGVEISWRIRISPLRVKPGSVHCGSTSRDNCSRLFPDEPCLGRPPGQDNRPTPTSFGQGCKCVLAKWPGSFTCIAVTREWNGQRIRLRKLTLGKKFFRRSCRNSNSNLLITSSATYQQLSRLP